ncbi:MAG: polyribonucleotide nucleotidyltransferase [Phycisphaerae bacterium]|nr:polyribonucleotide nucleotidyltransferase [Phycisphaerae bacterium]
MSESTKRIPLGIHEVERVIGGRTLRIETGRIARQAAGSVLVTYGETVVLGAVVGGPPREGIDFFPLTVDYREKTYAAGKFPGGFFKRESRPTNKEILTMRMIDRPMRPLFPNEYRDEVLIQCMVLSADLENEPDVIAMIAASAALAVSPIPFDGPVGAIRVGYIEGAHVLNPRISEMEFSTMEMVLAGHSDAVNMIEVGAAEVPDEVVTEGIAFGHKAIAEICDAIKELQAKAGKPKEWTPPPPLDDLREELRGKFEGRLREARSVSGKQDRYQAVADVYRAAKEDYAGGDDPESKQRWSKIKDLLDGIEKDILSEWVVREGRRSDGRGVKDIRPLTCEVNVLPRVHGSALFQRGETQSICVVTLGTGRDEQIVDGLSEEYSKKFMLHYNFPPLCTGEVKRVGATSRREIGHGNLAEKSLQYVLPSPDVFPYTIRLVSEIMESNGSSSMASVCGGCLALMDAGVPIRQPVAGISVGMFEHKDQYRLVVDILGEEDHFGEMDFKVAGSQRGVTAVQLDLKTRGLPQDRILETFKMAKEARMDILRTMLKALPAPRKATSSYAPRIITMQVNPEKIGKIIGPGGRYIRLIESETGATVEIEDDGTVRISSVDLDAAQKAIAMVEAVAAEVKVGRVYEGRVSSIKDFGAFVEIVPGQDGLCHISELDTGYVKSAADVVKVGDTIRVKVISVDDQGRVKLSRKAAMLEEQGEPAAVE